MTDYSDKNISILKTCGAYMWCLKAKKYARDTRQSLEYYK